MGPGLPVFHKPYLEYISYYLSFFFFNFNWSENLKTYAQQSEYRLSRYFPLFIYLTHIYLDSLFLFIYLFLAVLGLVFVSIQQAYVFWLEHLIHSRLK